MSAPYAVAAVAVLVNGVLLPSAPPPRLVSGHVVAPPALVARLAGRVTLDAAGRLIAQRDERRCAATAVSPAQEVALAPLARCLGADVQWNARLKTLLLTFDAPRPLRSHAPYDPAAPQAVPTAIFTPEPAPPTPRAIATGVPRPRRTAIPETPSLPARAPRP